jgi:hypothetical protein
MLAVTRLLPKTYTASDPRNRSVKCEYVYRSAKSLNCCITPSLAIKHANHILEIAKDLLSDGIEDMGVHIYSIGPGMSLGCGTTQLPKKGRSKK